MGKRVDGEVIPEIMRGRGSRVVVIKSPSEYLNACIPIRVRHDPFVLS
jgi:hypothetical protein